MKTGLGLIQVYTGDGKGKTTAAFGLALRALGRGWQVAVFQMLKAGDSSGEQLAGSRFAPDLQIVPLGTGRFMIGRAPDATEMALAAAGWTRLLDEAFSGRLNLLIIDEVSHAIQCGLLDLDQVTGFLRQKPPDLEVVLTGRGMPSAILELADLVTEMRAVKHPFTRGIEARKGMEY